VVKRRAGGIRQIGVAPNRDPDQIRAVEAKEAAIVVLAGPGSGKTRTLANRGPLSLGGASQRQRPAPYLHKQGRGGNEGARLARIGRVIQAADGRHLWC
jgi:hypothetical protein